MAYCTLDHLNDRFGPATIIALTDRADVPTGTVDLDVLNRAIGEADAMIDGYLAGRYALPLPTVPPRLTTLSMDITMWRLHIGEPSTKVKDDYNAAERALREIASGVSRIPELTGLEPAAPGTSGVVVTDRERPFAADQMKGFI